MMRLRGRETGRGWPRTSAVWLACVAALAALALLAAARAGVGRLEQAPGDRWQSLNDGLVPHATVAGLAVDPRDAQRIYVGTAEQGIWISDDGGASGTFAGGPVAGRVAYALAVDPGRPDELLAGTDAGLYSSDDDGRTWQRAEDVPEAAIFTLARDANGAALAGGAGPEIYRRAAGARGGWEKLATLPEATAVLALAAGPRSGLVLAGTDGAGLFRSRNGGSSWERVPEIGRTFVAGLAFAGEDGRTALARTRQGLYASGDGGESWRVVAGDLPGRVDALAAAGTGDLYLGTSEGELYRRAPGAPGWQRWGAGLGVPGLFSSLVIAPGTPSRWYAGTANGLYPSDDAGTSWRPAQPGPGRPAATALAMAADGSLLLGNGDGVYRSADGGLRWQRSGDGLPRDAVLALAPAAGDPGLVYAGLAGQGLYRSLDGGRRWSPTGWTKRGAPAVLVDPGDPQHLYIRVTYERVYESRDGGESWAARWDGLGLSTQIVSLAMDPRQPATLYAGGTEGFFRSPDAAGHWLSAGPELAGQTVFAIAIDPRDGALYAGATNGAYRSRDGGKRWQHLGDGLEDVTVTALALSPREPGRVFAGTKYRGVFESRDAGQHWAYAGPEPASVNGLLFAPDGGRLYAATAAGFYAMKVETP